MYCRKCGTKLEDAAAFCPNCGAAVNPAAETQTAASTSTSAIAPQLKNTRTEIRQFARSPLVLVTAVLFTLGILLSFRTSPLTLLTGFLSSYIDIPEISDILSIISGWTGAVGIFFNVLGNLPDIIIAIGIWLLVGSAWSNDNDGISTGGLTLIQVMKTIHFVGTLLIAAAGAVVLIAAFSEMDLNQPAYLVLIVLIAAVIGWVILYYVKLLGTLKNMRYAIATDTPSTKVSRLIIFCCYAGGIIEVLGSLTSISALLGAVSTILFGVILQQYRGKMIRIYTYEQSCR